MKILGEPIGAVDAQGRLASRVATIFLKTPGLVTKRAVHAMQRMMWLEELNRERAEAHAPPLTPEEEDDELSHSVDLILSGELVLIRPDPEHMDLALQADEALQSLVSKRHIRFLNTHSAKVRDTLRSRGENWRMARAPASPEDMSAQIQNSRVNAILEGERIYYYNHATGTRYLTCGGAAALKQREQIKEVVTLLSRRNRFAHAELDLFPTSTPPEIKQALKSLKVDELGDDDLMSAYNGICRDWLASLPLELHDESVNNFEWRNEMSQTLSSSPNEAAADERELIQGISPEFYRQIEWLPGARLNHGQIIFDSLWDEYIRTHDPELADICEERVRNIVFNLSRLFSEVEYCNIGRITHSLAKSPVSEERRRGSVYIIQVKPAWRPLAQIYMIRFQKWGIAEHLDEGKDLLRSIIEANEYSDYILDRRLMCQQLGMNLPETVGFGQISEPYRSMNQYNGTIVRSYYYIRPYVHGTASDKIPPIKFRNPAFAQKFARLMGEAAAVDLIVGRCTAETKENLFDKYYEVVQLGPDGLPARIKITDHTGSFANYLKSLDEMVAPYADVVRNRKSFVTQYDSFVEEYANAFEKRLLKIRSEYRERRVAYDELFVHRPFDTAGSGAYRWAKTLERLDKCNPAALTNELITAIYA